MKRPKTKAQFTSIFPFSFSRSLQPSLERAPSQAIRQHLSDLRPGVKRRVRRVDVLPQLPVEVGRGEGLAPPKVEVAQPVHPSLSLLGS